MAEASDPLSEGDVVQFTVSGFVAADPFRNVLHYKITDTPEGANVLLQLQTCATTLQAGVLNAYKAMLPTDGRITGIKVVRMNAGGSPTWQEGVVIDGTHEGDYLPVEDAIVFKKRTLQSGIGQAGSLYMPAISEAVNIGDYVEVGNALVTAMRAALLAPLDNGLTSFGTPVVWSRRTRTTPGESHDVVDVGINAKISHQRRRKPRF